MFNPFEKFTEYFIEAFRKKEKIYLVAQTYERGVDPFHDEGKIVLLLSHYENKSKADIHLSAIKGDRYAAVINLENEAHRNRLSEMMAPGSKYVLFSSIVKSIEETEARMNRKYKQNMKRYIQKTTHWSIPGGTSLIGHLEISYGELFITMKWANQTIRPKLEDVEKS